MKVGDLVKVTMEGRHCGLLAVVTSDGETIWDGTPIHNIRFVNPSPLKTKIVDRYLNQNLELVSESW